MTSVKKSRVVSFSCKQMYELVNDVEQYEKFVPHCSQSIVHHRNEDEVQAALTIAAAGMNKPFTTCNRLQANKMIEIRLIDGPFSHLEGFWRFDEVPEGCHISFDLEFEFSNRFFSMLLSPIFEQVAEKMLDAFCNRAEEIHGQR